MPLGGRRVFAFNALLFSGRGGFNPGDYAPVAWWDPSDASSVTVDGSNRISAIADKSGNGRSLVQVTAGKQPLFESAPAGFNGNSAVYFAYARQDYLYLATVPALSTGTVYLVCRVAGTTGGLQVVCDIGQYSFNGSIIFYMAPTGADYLCNWENSGTSRQSNSYGSRVGATHLESWLFDPAGNGAAPARRLEVDGAQKTLTSVASSGANGSTNTTYRWSIGATGSGSYACEARIGEVLVFSSQHDANTRASFTSYLKTKWGIP